MLNEKSKDTLCDIKSLPQGLLADMTYATQATDYLKHLSKAKRYLGKNATLGQYLHAYNRYLETPVDDADITLLIKHRNALAHYNRMLMESPEREEKLNGMLDDCYGILSDLYGFNIDNPHRVGITADEG